MTGLLDDFWCHPVGSALDALGPRLCKSWHLRSGWNKSTQQLHSIPPVQTQYAQQYVIQVKMLGHCQRLLYEGCE